MADLVTSVNVADGLFHAPVSFLGEPIPWKAAPGNYLQNLMLDLKTPSMILAAMLRPKYLRSIASNDVSVVNKMLRDEGFTIQLANAGMLNMLYVASVMKLLGEFYRVGETDYYLPDIGKKAFRLGPEANARLYTYGKNNYVAELPTRSGFSLLITQPRNASGFEMLLDWRSLISSMKKTEGNGVILPMAVINETEIEVKQLVGMQGGNWIIQEAIMAAKFALTPKMVKFESAFAYSAKRFCLMEYKEPQKGDFVCDFPPYMALYFPGYLLPLAAISLAVSELSNEVPE